MTSVDADVQIGSVDEIHKLVAAHKVVRQNLSQPLPHWQPPNLPLPSFLQMVFSRSTCAFAFEMKRTLVRTPAATGSATAGGVSSR